MKVHNKLISLILTVLSPIASAGLITFDDAHPDLGEGNKAFTYYTSTQGATLSGNFYGLVGGVSNGDTGNWNLDGTNGPAFLGCNSGDLCSPTVLFNSDMSSLSVDIGLPGFNWAGEFIVSAYLDNVLVDSQTVTLSSGSTEYGPWQTVSFADGLYDSFIVTASFTSGFGFGLDNISFEVASVPEPMSILLFGCALAGIRLSKRKNA